MKLRFEGRSDDRFGEHESFNVEHDNCADGTPIQWRVTAPGGESLIVTGLWCPGGSNGWMIGVSSANEDPSRWEAQPIPDWPIRFARAKGADTPSLSIDAPDSTTIKLMDTNTGTF